MMISACCLRCCTCGCCCCAVAIKFVYVLLLFYCYVEYISFFCFPGINKSHRKHKLITKITWYFHIFFFSKNAFYTRIIWIKINKWVDYSLKLMRINMPWILWLLCCHHYFVWSCVVCGCNKSFLGEETQKSYYKNDGKIKGPFVIDRNHKTKKVKWSEAKNKSTRVKTFG